MDKTNPCELVPDWLLWPLPTNAAADEALLTRLDGFAKKLPRSLQQMDLALRDIRSSRAYDVAANRACAHVWLALENLYAAPDPTVRKDLLAFANEHMVERARARIVRRLVKDPDTTVRYRALRAASSGRLREVALPLDKKASWDSTGWQKGVIRQPLTRHKQGQRVLQRLGLPKIGSIAELRELLGIRSAKQLGYFLLASDHGDGPYTKFTIPKRDGSDRDICAPKAQLRWVQRQILDKILDQVPPHSAAHGFIAGRSIVTNAALHKNAAVLLKFDLTDFFPTIHYFRVVGLFASLGYYVEDGRFSANDNSRQIAATLARLCCYTPDPKLWSRGVLPQGAPTSPAISNLVCRRLDARLEGLAKKNGGVYSRYADDLTFSFQADAVDLGRFRWWVDQVCHQEGFFVKQSKFRIIRASQRQTVTGIVVNDTLHIPREQRRRFRAILHNCLTHGIDSQARGRKDFEGYLRGFASYVYMVHPEEGENLMQQVEEILASANGASGGQP